MFVRPSRDPVWLNGSPSFNRTPIHGTCAELTDNLAPAPGDTLHIYGSDETIAEVKANLPSAVDVRATERVLAWVCLPHPTTRSHHRSAANDLIAFDGRGCADVLVNADEQLHSMTTSRRTWKRWQTTTSWSLSDAILGRCDVFEPSSNHSADGSKDHHAIGIDVDPSPQR